MRLTSLNPHSQTLLKKTVFPFTLYGYKPIEILNARSRWPRKIVYKIAKEGRFYVATVLKEKEDFLGLIRTIDFLSSYNKFFPKVVGVFPDCNMIICEYIGEKLIRYLLENDNSVFSIVKSVWNYLEDINSINRDYRLVYVPDIIKETFSWEDKLKKEFVLLAASRLILHKIESLNIKFPYGYGIDDPHIWNFRVVKNDCDRVTALTTDFDYFSCTTNIFWELGYFYATFRWVKKASPSFRRKVTHAFTSLIKNYSLKSQFMFWLGVLSSFCGYRDSIMNLIDRDILILKKQYAIIRQLDYKVYILGKTLIEKEAGSNENKFLKKEKRFVF